MQLFYITDKPGPPSNLRVTNTGPGSLTLAWDVPTSDGGSPITAYIVEVRGSVSISYNKAAEVDGSMLTYQLTDLVDGAEYYVRVAAQNMAGVSKGWTELDTPVAARTPISEFFVGQGVDLELLSV